MPVSCIDGGQKPYAHVANYETIITGTAFRESHIFQLVYNGSGNISPQQCKIWKPCFCDKGL